MKLIKIKEDHYIVVVDDLEIDYDNEPYLLIKDDYETYIHKHRGDNKPTSEHYKITHSTRPFGGNAIAISLQEVKELIGEKSWKGYIDGTEWEVEFVDGKLKLKL
jgi:hypothetical protein